MPRAKNVKVTATGGGLFNSKKTPPKADEIQLLIGEDFGWPSDYSAANSGTWTYATLKHRGDVIAMYEDFAGADRTLQDCIIMFAILTKYMREKPKENIKLMTTAQAKHFSDTINTASIQETLQAGGKKPTEPNTRGGMGAVKHFKNKMFNVLGIKKALTNGLDDADDLQEDPEEYIPLPPAATAISSALWTHAAPENEADVTAMYADFAGDANDAGRTLQDCMSLLRNLKTYLETHTDGNIKLMSEAQAKHFSDTINTNNTVSIHKTLQAGGKARNRDCFSCDKPTTSSEYRWQEVPKGKKGRTAAKEMP